jgi:N-methylhydantoinase A
MKRVAVDIGGTFTDLVWLDEKTQGFGRTKALSTRDSPEIGLLDAIDKASISPEEVDLFLHATTIITNLIITRSGGTVGFVTTAGFRDVLEIQTGLRPNPYDLQWEKTPPLVPRYLRREITERIDAQGNVLTATDGEEIKRVLEGLVGEGIEALAVCLLNSYKNPTHEQAVAAVAREYFPQIHLSLSYEIDPRIREYPRMSTTVVNAYAMPGFSRYASTLETKLPIGTGIKFMQSSGGVVGAAQAAKAPVNLVYSGPVGGVLGGKLLGRTIGNENLITIDMGGTSFDVCVVRDGEADEKDELYVQWGIPVRTHTVDIHSIGAGGGSIVEIDPGGALKVGPKSAGSNPGPACYGRGGESATVTDANLILGLVRPGQFAGGDIVLSPELARQVLEPVAKHLDLSLHEAAEGVYRIVNSNMAQAIREITVFKGVDPREFTLVAFGGGGPQHAVEVAREMGMTSIIIPVFPSVFSAFGLLSADLLNTATRTVLCPVAALDSESLRQDLRELEDVAKEPLLAEEVVEEIVIRRIGFLRYIGQSHELPIELGESFDGDTLYQAFEKAHLNRYGTQLRDPAEMVDLKVVAVGQIPKNELKMWTQGSKDPKPTGTIDTAFGQARTYDREEMGTGAEVSGPALIEERDTTTYLPADARARVDDYGNIRIQIP